MATSHPLLKRDLRGRGVSRGETISIQCLSWVLGKAKRPFGVTKFVAADHESTKFENGMLGTGRDLPSGNSFSNIVGGLGG